MAEPITHVQLRWEDPLTGELQQPILSLPVALGREFSQMPALIKNQAVTRVVLNDKQVSRYHALLFWDGGRLVVTDRSANGTILNGQRLHQASQSLKPRDLLRLGPYTLTVEPLTAADPNSTELRPTTNNTFSRKPSGLWENPTAMASLALLLLLVAAGGAWLVVGAVLSQYRPRPDVEDVTPNPPTPVP